MLRRRAMMNTNELEDLYIIRNGVVEATTLPSGLYYSNTKHYDCDGYIQLGSGSGGCSCENYSADSPWSKLKKYRYIVLDWGRSSSYLHFQIGAIHSSSGFIDKECTVATSKQAGIFGIEVIDLLSSANKPIRDTFTDELSGIYFTTNRSTKGFLRNVYATNKPPA